MVFQINWRYDRAAMTETQDNQPNNLTTLAIDTAMGGVSVGVIAANGHVVSRQVETARGQAAILVPLIQEVIAEAQITMKDIDLIVVTRGPGSFTGLRIGLSTARTLALALDKPIVGLNTLDVMAGHYETDGNLLIVLETKRQDFYARYYDGEGNPLTDAFAAEVSEVVQNAPKAGFSVGGDCLNRFQESASGDFTLLDNLIQPDPILIAQMGREQYIREGSRTPKPLYLRGADVSQPKTLPRKLEEAAS